jgi:hypothetical protein
MRMLVPSDVIGSGTCGSAPLGPRDEVTMEVEGDHGEPRRHV